VFLDAVEGCEELGHGFCVCFLCGGETGAIDAIVDIRIDPFVRGLDFLLEVFGKEDYVLVFLREEVVKLQSQVSHLFPTSPLTTTSLARQGNIPRYKTS
jgi:hypothetical protein